MQVKFIKVIVRRHIQIYSIVCRLLCICICWFFAELLHFVLHNYFTYFTRDGQILSFPRFQMFSACDNVSAIKAKLQIIELVLSMHLDLGQC